MIGYLKHTVTPCQRDHLAFLGKVVQTAGTTQEWDGTINFDACKASYEFLHVQKIGSYCIFFTIKVHEAIANERKNN